MARRKSEPPTELKECKSVVPATQNQEMRKYILEEVKYGGLLGVQVSSKILEGIVKNDPNVDSFDISTRLMKQAMDDFSPKSAAERMLVEQLVVTHSQLLNIQKLTCRTDQYDRIEQMAAVASRLQADFRKTLLALKEWKAPPKSFIVAQQANIANQQVVTQNPEKTNTTTNELGTNHA